MNKESEPILEDLATLAANAPSPVSIGIAQNGAEANKRLAAGLDRVRGEVIQRAKAANARLRRRALAATVTGFGIGMLFGYFLSCRNSKIRL